MANTQKKPSKLGPIQTILILLPFIATFVLGFKMVYILGIIRKFINGSENVIMVAPGFAAAATAPVTFFILLIPIALVSFILIVKGSISSVTSVIKAFFQGFINPKDGGKRKKYGMRIFLILLILGVLNTLIDYSIIYKDKIFMRNVFNILGKYYSYDDIQEVEVGKIKGSVFYYLDMNDGSQIDLGTLKSNLKYIEEVESHIGTRVPHSAREYDNDIELLRGDLPDSVLRKFH